MGFHILCQPPRRVLCVRSAHRHTFRKSACLLDDCDVLRSQLSLNRLNLTCSNLFSGTAACLAFHSVAVSTAAQIRCVDIDGIWCFCRVTAQSRSLKIPSKPKHWTPNTFRRSQRSAWSSSAAPSERSSALGFTSSSAIPGAAKQMTTSPQHPPCGSTTFPSTPLGEGAAQS